MAWDLEQAGIQKAGGVMKDVIVLWAAWLGKEKNKIKMMRWWHLKQQRVSSTHKKKWFCRNQLMPWVGSGTNQSSCVYGENFLCRSNDIYIEGGDFYKGYSCIYYVSSYTSVETKHAQQHLYHLFTQSTNSPPPPVGNKCLFWRVCLSAPLF